ncbi:membrane protein [Marivirga tractuosa]|uniref:DUF502 domain-containing protein n=1 Tax=Marivirga tractuosa (strain ATCC 23168 / DSM 4126 / NBRC 15989 / NCIMB 1408 / VKM B-1430 / H-43) TaxID=643867 RepID=E4TPF1_MARTH|nr:DUF502 domain-containing protein [Marivirga tractuosa]ADR21539.1 protein of unknown function DUF502 [Marivirga tractuosa DSM 4126]BDD14007.1 membrane protein [Marivirga tractuosa]
MRQRILTKIAGYFFRGLLFVAPIAFTLLVIQAVFNWLDGLLPVNIPGLGIVILVSAIIGIGYLGSTYFMKPFFEMFEQIITKIPLLSLIYNSIKDLVGAFVGDKKKFNEPVMVQFDESGKIFKPGFITQSDLSKVELDGYCSVYMPHSYNFSGNIIVVKNDLVRPWDVNSTNAMKFIVSGGVSGFEDM